MNPYYLVECYSDGDPHPKESAEALTEREARRIAARMLGHRSLRGAASWDRYQGGVVYQFGPRIEDNGYDFAVVIAPCGELAAEMVSEAIDQLCADGTIEVE